MLLALRPATIHLRLHTRAAPFQEDGCASAWSHRLQIGRRAAGPAASGEGAPPYTCIARRPKQHLNRVLTTSADTGNTDTQTQPLVSSTRSQYSCTIARTLLRYTPHLLCGSKHDVSSVAFTTLPKYLPTICWQRRFRSLQSEDRKSRARLDDRNRTRC